VVKPKQVRQLRSQIVWNAHLRFRHQIFEELDAVASHGRRSVRKTGSATVRIGSRLEEYAGKFMIRLKRVDLEPYHGKQAALFRDDSFCNAGSAARR